MSMLLSRASALSWGAPASEVLVDVRIDAGLIVEIGLSLERRASEAVWDLDGDRIAPGLHDHHIHLRALCALESSVIVGPPEIQTRDELIARLHRAGARLVEGQWMRGVAYHESVAGLLDRDELDQLIPDRPARIQHASGSLWILNSRAIDALKADEGTPPGGERDEQGRLTGRFWREDDWLGSRLPRTSHDFSAMSSLAASRGITGFTDATPGARDIDLAGFIEAIESRILVQRLHLMVEPGTTPPGAEMVTLGASKILLDDLGLPTFDELVERISGCHAASQPVAVHCVTRTQSILTVAALEQTGTIEGDRIEHASILGTDSIEAVARLGLVIVTQPGLVMTRGDRFLRDVPARSQPDLYRVASLMAAGATVAASTDAPFGSPDPWVAVEAAVDRQTHDGARLNPAEAVDPLVAIGMFTGEAAHPGRTRRIEVGAPADLCVVGKAGRGDASPTRPEIKGTFVAGRLVYAAP
jgi:predicted amidohydrolase YtcJ